MRLLYFMRYLKFFIGAIWLLILMNGLVFPVSGWAMVRAPRKPEVAPSKFEEPAAALTLFDCYDLALRRSETVAISREAIKRTEADFFKAASEALGDVSFVMTNTRQEVQKGSDSSSSVGSTFNASSRRERKFVIEQPLFQGFKSLAAVRGSGSLKTQRREERIRAEHLLFIDVVDAFYGLLHDERDVGIIEEIYSLLEERIRDLEQRESIGRSRMSEVATAKARLKIAEAQLARAHGALAVSENLIEFLIGRRISSKELRGTPFSASDAFDLEAALGSVDDRPDVSASRQMVKTAWQSVVSNQSALWPEITLENNQYEKREGFQSGIDWDLLLKINVPLFRGGGSVGNIKAALSDWRKAKWVYARSKREAELEIKDAYANWMAASDEYKALQEAVRASAENFAAQKDEYAHNLVNNLDVLEALRELNENRKEENRSHYNMISQYYRLQVAMGKCCESI